MRNQISVKITFRGAIYTRYRDWFIYDRKAIHLTLGRSNMFFSSANHVTVSERTPKNLMIKKEKRIF
jgi:hypothetical protein